MSQVEALRIWRVSTLYDIQTASLDDLWPLLAAQFVAPDTLDSVAASADRGETDFDIRIVISK